MAIQTMSKQNYGWSFADEGLALAVILTADPGHTGFQQTRGLGARSDRLCLGSRHLSSSGLNS